MLRLRQSNRARREPAGDIDDRGRRLRRCARRSLAPATSASARCRGSRRLGRRNRMIGRALPLPTRDGVGASCVALPEGPWPTIASFLAERFPAIAPAVWAQRIADGEVLDEDGSPVTPTRAHQPRLRIYYYRS